MHMRKKHKEGTKQEIERRRGIRVKEILRSQVTLPMAHYTQDPAGQQHQQNMLLSQQSQQSSERMMSSQTR